MYFSGLHSVWRRRSKTVDQPKIEIAHENTTRNTKSLKISIYDRLANNRLSLVSARCSEWTRARAVFRQMTDRTVLDKQTIVNGIKITGHGFTTIRGPGHTII